MVNLTQTVAQFPFLFLDLPRDIGATVSKNVVIGLQRFALTVLLLFPVLLAVLLAVLLFNHLLHHFHALLDAFLYDFEIDQI